MNNTWSKSIYKFVIFHLLGLVLFLISFILINVYSKKTQTQAIVSGVSQNYIIGDYRSVTLTLENALLFNYEHIEVFDYKNNKLLSVGSSNNKDKKITAKTEENIYFGKNNNSLIGKIFFYYSLMPILTNGLFIYLLIIIISMPYIFLLNKKLNKQYQLELNLNLNAIRVSIAEQVSHDIRSPVAALNMVIDEIENIPANYRSIIQSSTQRINDIANNLLSSNKTINLNNNISANNELSIELIPLIIDSLVSEKRMEYRHHSGLEIDLDLKHSSGAFAYVNQNEMCRILSNLINNSVESFDVMPGKISIKVKKTNENIIIRIEDNGKGIPENIRVILGKEKISFGKHNEKFKGNGLGLYYAKKIIESQFNGKLEINSTSGKGTVISIHLPACIVPKWFAKEIDLSNKNIIVSMDDDFSIHQMWERRFTEFEYKNINHYKIQSIFEFKKFVNCNYKNLEKILFLVDYQLINQNISGLDLIKDLKIENHSLLVTSRFENKTIQNTCNEIGVKILPKSLAPTVSMNTNNKKQETYNMVLIDDDDLVRTTWEMRASKKGIKLLSLAKASDLWINMHLIDHETVFYVDVNLSENENGEQITHKLFQMGFQNLYLATGFEPNKFSHVNWIKGVTGKNFNSINNLI